MSSTHSNQQEQQPFTFNLKDPYESLIDGSSVSYVIDGLLTAGGFSIIAGKSKHGKSSLARYEAVCVAKGEPFLNRDVAQGDVIIVNLEDPISHVANCLTVLGHDPAADAQIRVIERVAPTVAENVAALGDVLTNNPDVKLVVIDTLAKFIRVKDISEYMPVLTAMEQIHKLARQFPHVHIQGLAHSKKLVTDDPFDGLLGSTALRGETDTNIAIYGVPSQRIIASETRIGRCIHPTLLKATLEERGGADVVSDFQLGQSVSEWESEKSDKAEKKGKESYQARIVTYLKSCPEGAASQEAVLREVTGKRQSLISAIEALKEGGVLKTSGVKQSPTSPLTLHLDADNIAASLYSLGKGYSEAVN